MAARPPRARALQETELGERFRVRTSPVLTGLPERVRQPTGAPTAYMAPGQEGQSCPWGLCDTDSKVVTPHVLQPRQESPNEPRVPRDVYPPRYATSFADSERVSSEPKVTQQRGTELGTELTPSLEAGSSLPAP